MSSQGVHTLLLHLERVGFDGAPRYLGTDEHGREVLSFVEGEVPLPPYPAWAMTDDVLTDVARLLRRYHEAVADFSPADVTTWMSEFTDPLGGSVMCHNDVSPENVVFRDGRPVALIDFDLAAPGRALWDVAITVRGWAPLAPRRRDTTIRAPSTVSTDFDDSSMRMVFARGTQRSWSMPSSLNANRCWLTSTARSPRESESGWTTGKRLTGRREPGRMMRGFNIRGPPWSKPRLATLLQASELVRPPMGSPDRPGSRQHDG